MTAIALAELLPTIVCAPRCKRSKFHRSQPNTTGWHSGYYDLQYTIDRKDALVFISASHW